MERLFRLLLFWTFFETRAFTSEAELDDFVDLWHVLAALRNDALHVATLGSDEAPCYLELALIRDLYVVATRVLDLALSTVIVHAHAKVLIERCISTKAGLEAVSAAREALHWVHLVASCRHKIC